MELELDFDKPTFTSFFKLSSRCPKKKGHSYLGKTIGRPASKNFFKRADMKLTQAVLSKKKKG